MIKEMDRRQFILRLSRIGIGVTTASWLLRIQAGGDEMRNANAPHLSALIVELSYLLLPLREPTSTVYQSVSIAVMEQMTQRPGAAEIAAQGIASMDRFAGKPWLMLTPVERKKVLQSLFDTPFVGMVRWVTQEVVLRDRQVWRQLGYQGSSIEQGGYLQRGFDDIDWLPVMSKEKK